MDDPKIKAPPRGRGAIRWFLFLSFFHLLPTPWYMAVIAGLAPASFLFAGGVVSLFLPDNDSFAFAAFLLAPALLGGLLMYLAAALLARLQMLIARPWLRTALLLVLVSACLAAASQPIYFYGGHGSSGSYTLHEFIRELESNRIPLAFSYGYHTVLALVLFGLLSYQHQAVGQPPISRKRALRRRFVRRRLLVVMALLLVLSFAWTHRMLLFVLPLANMGIATAQYHLAMAIKEGRGAAAYGSPVRYQEWLERAAEQGHAEAALQLVLHPRSKEEKLRWLTVAAERGMAEAQYQLYQLLLKDGGGVASSAPAREWLQRAADNDYPQAQYELGRHLLRGHAVLEISEDREAAHRWWEKAARDGHGRAMKELSWRLAKGADGFPRDAERAIELMEMLADGYQRAEYGLSQNDQMAASKREKAEKLTRLEARLQRGDADAQAQVADELLSAAGASPGNLEEGLALLEKAAAQGDARLQYELGAIYLFGRHEQIIDQVRGRSWWDRALAQHHVKTMEYVAPAYQSGRFGYPVDLLKSQVLVEKLVAAYAEGRYGVDPDPQRERYWQGELDYFERLFELAGGSYLPPGELQGKAEAGDAAAQYRYGRQLLVSGPKEQRQQGLIWIERAAENGYAEAQYRLVTTYEQQVGIMRSDPARGVEFLTAAAQQNHLPAMGTLALGYHKGRYGLKRDYASAKQWYERLLQLFDEGEYLGEIDERFIPFQRRQLEYASKALETAQANELRYRQASPLERQVIEIEERYHREYERAVNMLKGSERTREAISRLRDSFYAQRDEEIARFRAASAGR